MSASSTLGRRLTAFAVIAGVSVAWASCGSDATPVATGGTGGGVVDPHEKPVCPDPGAPLNPAPAARADTAGALSADGSLMLVFGGDVATVVCGDVPARTHVGDTWLLDTACGDWREVMPAAAPSPRARHSIAQDHVSDRAILFGGRFRPDGASGNYTHYNDTWSFDFQTREWTELVTNGTPPAPRSDGAAVVAGNRLIVFGGNTSPSGLSFSPLADTHVLDLETLTWTELATTGAPQARLFHTMAYDAEHDRVYVIGGGDENAFFGPFFADVWALDLATSSWHEIAASGLGDVDRARIKGALVYRETSEAGPGALFAFAGHDSTSFADVRNDVSVIGVGDVALPPSAAVPWDFVRIGDVYKEPLNDQCDIPPDYVELDVESPERRQGFALGHTTDGGAFLIVGGDADCGKLSDAWWFNTFTATWTAVRETPPGLSCPRLGNPDCVHYCF